MLTPSIFGENLFDEFFDDFFDFPVFDDRAMKKAQKKLYGRHAANMMKTDVKEQDDHYEVDIDLPGFKKEELSLELKNGYLMINAAKGLDKEEKEEKTGRFVRRERYVGKYEQIVLCGRGYQTGRYSCEVRKWSIKTVYSKTGREKMHR